MEFLAGLISGLRSHRSPLQPQPEPNATHLIHYAPPSLPSMPAQAGGRPMVVLSQKQKPPASFFDDTDTDNESLIDSAEDLARVSSVAQDAYDAAMAHLDNQSEENRRTVMVAPAPRPLIRHPFPVRKSTTMVPELPSGFPDPLTLGQLRTRRTRKRTNILDVSAEIRYRIYDFLPAGFQHKITMDGRGMRTVKARHCAANLMLTCRFLKVELRDYFSLGTLRPTNVYDLPQVTSKENPQRMFQQATCIRATVEVVTRGQGIERYFAKIENLQRLEIEIRPQDLGDKWWLAKDDDHRLRIFQAISWGFDYWDLVRNGWKGTQAVLIAPVGCFCGEGLNRRIYVNQLIRFTINPYNVVSRKRTSMSWAAPAGAAQPSVATIFV